MFDGQNQVPVLGFIPIGFRAHSVESATQFKAQAESKLVDPVPLLRSMHVLYYVGGVPLPTVGIQLYTMCYSYILEMSAFTNRFHPRFQGLGYIQITCEYKI